MQSRRKRAKTIPPSVTLYIKWVEFFENNVLCSFEVNEINEPNVITYDITASKGESNTDARSNSSFKITSFMLRLYWQKFLLRFSEASTLPKAYSQPHSLQCLWGIAYASSVTGLVAIQNGNCWLKADLK